MLSSCRSAIESVGPYSARTICRDVDGPVIDSIPAVKDACAGEGRCRIVLRVQDTAVSLSRAIDLAEKARQVRQPKTGVLIN